MPVNRKIVQWEWTTCYSWFHCTKIKGKQFLNTSPKNYIGSLNYTISAKNLGAKVILYLVRKHAVARWTPERRDVVQLHDAMAVHCRPMTMMTPTTTQMEMMSNWSRLSLNPKPKPPVQHWDDDDPFETVQTMLAPKRPLHLLSVVVTSETEQLRRLNLLVSRFFSFGGFIGHRNYVKSWTLSCVWKISI